MKTKIIESKGRMFIETYEGETIEDKVRRILENKEPIGDNATMIYTNYKDGVIKAYDIRTDKWDVALDAMNNVNKIKIDEIRKNLEGTNAGPKEERKEAASQTP